MKIAIALLLLLSSVVLPAQDKGDSPTIRKTQKILTKSYSLRPYFFMNRKDGDGIFFMFSKINFFRKFKGYGIAYLSRDGKTTQSADLPLTFEGKELDYRNIVYIDNRIHLLTSFYNTGSGSYTVFKQELSPKTLLPVSELRELYSEDLSRKSLQLNTSRRMKSKGEELVMQRRFYDKKVVLRNDSNSISTTQIWWRQKCAV